MAAPTTNITWGDIAGGYGRIGIYHSLSSTNTETTLTVEVWFWSKYSVADNLGNALYLDNLASSGSAITDRGGTNIQTKVASGSGWSTSNQVKLTGKSYTWKHTRGTSATTRYLYAKLTGVDRVGATMTASKTVSIPALAKYTISYNANGGLGAPSSQTKYYGTALTLSSTKPTRTGYSFQGWALTKDDADDGTWYYKAGGSCGKNENLTLYAVWKANTYVVKYDANGGTGAPTEQTKTYGVTLKLSTTVPKRTNYNFLGWATSKTATEAAYKAGANYTTDKAVTLYAVWELAYVKPRITNLSVGRVNQIVTDEITYEPSDTGTYVLVSFDWECDKSVSSVEIELEPTSGSIIAEDVDVSGLKGAVAWIFENVSTEYTYTVRVKVTDSVGYNVALTTIPGSKFIIDILAEGKGIAFNKPAELEGVADIGFQTRLLGGIKYVLLEPETDLDECHTPGFYMGENVSTYNYVNCPLTSGTFTLEILSMGDNGQLMQRLTQCHISAPIVFERTYYESAGWGEWFGGWITAELDSNFGAYNDNSSNTPKYRKDGRTVEIRGVVTPTLALEYSNSPDNIIFTLPVGYRPNLRLDVLCQGSGNAIWLLSVNTNGNVYFSRYRLGENGATANAGAWLPFQLTFLV